MLKFLHFYWPTSTVFLINSCFSSSSISAKQKLWGVSHLLHMCVILFYFSEVLKKVWQLSFFMDHSFHFPFLFGEWFFQISENFGNSFIKTYIICIYLPFIYKKPITLSSVWIIVWNSLCNKYANSSKNFSVSQAKKVLGTEKHFFILQSSFGYKQFFW